MDIALTSNFSHSTLLWAVAGQICRLNHSETRHLEGGACYSKKLKLEATLAVMASETGDQIRWSLQHGMLCTSDTCGVWKDAPTLVA